MDCDNNIQGTLLKGVFIIILLMNCAGAATLNVPGTYATIQAAINVASTGDTILVQSGVYYENVNVNKTLTLQGVDTGSGLPVVYAAGNGDVITLSADGCILEGFVAKNLKYYGYAGISVTSDGNTISGNTATGNYYGISVYSSSGNIISGNTATGNYEGILLASSSGNTISGNNATGNNEGIFLGSSSGNTISNNIANGNGRDGIYIGSLSNSNIISGNTATGNLHGILLYLSMVNTISGNTATGNIAGDIILGSSSGNTIYLNTIDSGSSNSANIWKSPTEIDYAGATTYVGNRWSGYIGWDCNGDGIGDTPYLIADGSEMDYYPIGGAQPGPALEAEKIADRSEAQVGDVINYTIRVNNTGNVTLTGVRAEDNLTSTVWTVGTLTPGQNYTNTTRYQVLPSDLPGPLTNQLLVNATDPCGTEVNASAIETVEISYNCSNGPRTLTVCASGCNFTTIQAAINAACPGDTIEVHSGAYYEHVNVNKTLTLHGLDTGAGLPVVDGSGSGIAITLSADGCNLNGFVAKNSENGIWVTSDGNTISGNTAMDNVNYGIYLDSSTKNTIKGNTATGNVRGIWVLLSADNIASYNTVTDNAHSGIYLDSSINNTITGNTATDNLYGIVLSSSDGSTISGNTVTDNSDSGIYLEFTSDNNTVSNNTVSGNANHGILLYSSSDNTISGNTVSGSNQRGIYLSSSGGNTVTGNTVTGAIQHGIYLTSSRNNNISSNTANDNSGSGIYLYTSSNNNIVSNNTASNNQYGIRLFASIGNNINGNTANDNEDGFRLASAAGNTIEGNTANSNSDRGIYLASSSNNIIRHNTVTSNTNYGIRISSSSGNTIYLNTFDNANNSWSDRTNHWNATTSVTWGHDGRTLTGLLGNMWSDYDGLDCDGDGIGDTPYSITGGSDKDYHPIGRVQPGPALEAEKLADRSEALVGEVINYTIRVNNTGNVTLTGVWAEDNLTSTIWTVGTLAPGQNYTNTTRYQVKLSDLPGPLKNEIWANGTNPCGTEVNASAIETVDLRYIPQIMVNKTANLTGGAPATVIDFYIDVNNTGNTDFSSVEVNDLLPVGLDYLSDDSGLAHSQAGNKYTWDLGILNSSDSFSFNLTARINGNRFGDLVNSVNATGDTGYGDPVNSSATASVLAYEANMSVTKSADPSFGSAGTLINFTLTVTNNGSASLSHVFVSDKLPSGLVYDSSSAGGANSGRYVNWTDVGPLSSGASRPLWIKARIDGSVYETLSNRVDVEGRPEQGENVKANASATVLAQEAMISVTKSADRTFGSTGTLINFTLTINNTGPSALPHVFVSDLLPAGLAYDSSAGGANSGQYINWTDVGLLSSGASRTLWIKARIDGTVSGTLINCVNVTGSPGNGDQVKSNASADVESSIICISGHKFQNSTGQGLADWTIVVSNTTDRLTVVTNGTGYWEVCGLAAGDYTISEELQDGWQQIFPSDCYQVTVEKQNLENQDFYNEPLNLCLSGNMLNNITRQGLAGGTINVNNSTKQWTAVTNDTGCWQVCNLLPGQYTVCEQLKDGWTPAISEGCHNVILVNESISDLNFYYDPARPECNLTLTKTVDKPTVHRGEDITYTIDLSSNPCAWGSFTNVTLWDILPKSVELVSVYPAPSSSSSSNLTWDVGTLSPKQHFWATIVVRVPIVDINYDMTQEVRGTGFVNVHNDYDTHQGPESITNCAYARADLVETVSSCASTGIVDPGTQLQSREFGSGTYESEELTRMRTENKSIRSISNLSAVHRPTTFSLPLNRSIDYGTKWTDKSRGINAITGATMNEQYAFASKIDKDRSIELDRNGSTMKTEVEFSGAGHIGVLKKESPDAHPRSKPVYEAGEDYQGSFRVFEIVDEYGSSVKSNKSVAGYGYVAVDKRVQGSQRTYESGTGSYQSDEIIDTPSNYIAKDISLVRGPTGYNYTPRFSVSQNMLWSEGMWSRSGYLAGGDIFKDSSNCGLPITKTDSGSSPASYIGERFSSLDYLKKETVASGLNEMKTNASFSGLADFKVKSIGESRQTKVDNEERYMGRYDITRKVLLTGVSRYDRPHITVQKVGNMTTGWFNKTNAQVARYVITITNDGNVALAPINVRDIFPPGTEYIGSSIRPTSLSRADVNWTLVHLGIGNTVEIELELNVTQYAPENVVNRVMVCAMNKDVCVSGAAYFAFESAQLPCCPMKVAMDKFAHLDATDPTLVHFTIEVSNNADRTLAATLTDMLPAGLTYLSASPEPNRHEGQFMEWIVPDLQPGDVQVIEYQSRATRDGSYVNTVHLDATAVDGTGYDTADAAAQVLVSSTGVAPKTTRYGGWQPPNWNMTSPDEGVTIDLSPDEDPVG